ncbi:MAG: phage tail length tape measure family protein [Acidobacteriota bacterium]
MAGNVDILFRAELDASGAVLGLKRLEQEAQQSARGLTSLGSQAGGLSGKFGALTSSVSNLWGAFAAAGAVAAASSFLKHSVAAAIEAEQSQVKLEAVLKATGYTAGVSADQISEYASRMQSLTGVGDDTIKSAAAVLATFRNVREDAFERTMTAALDLSAVFGQDLQSSVTMLGKALEDPIQGMTALRRVGVSFSQSEQQVIKDLVEHNRLAEAQARILEVVERQAGGTAAALGQTLGGQLNILKETFGDFQESVGASVVKLLNLGEVASTWTGWLKDWNTYGTEAVAVTTTFKNTLVNLVSYTNLLGAALRVLGILHKTEVEDIKVEMDYTNLSTKAIATHVDMLRQRIAATNADLKATSAGTAERDRLLKQLMDQKARLGEAEQRLAAKTREEHAAAKATGELANQTRVSSEALKEHERQMKAATAETLKGADAALKWHDQWEEATRTAFTFQVDNLAREFGRDFGSHAAPEVTRELTAGLQDALSLRSGNVDVYGLGRDLGQRLASGAASTLEIGVRNSLQDAVETGPVMPESVAWSRALAQTLAEDIDVAVGRGLTDGILGTLSGDDFRDAFSGVWQNLWNVAGGQLDTVFQGLLGGQGWQQSLQNAGLVNEQGKVSWQGVGGMAGGLLMGYGAQKGNRGASALGGAVSGATMGSAFGPWGTVIGAVVGAVAGYIMGGAGSGGRNDYYLQYNARQSGLPIVNLEGVGSEEEQQLARQFIDAYKKYRVEFRDTLKDLGLSIGADQWAGLKVGSVGSTKDFNSWFKGLISGHLPRAMFDMFSGDIAGALGDLGVSEGRISTEFAALQTGTFDTAWSGFRNWLSALTELSETGDLLGKTSEEMRTEVNKSFRDVFLEGFDDVLSKARDLTTGLDGLFSEEQVSNAQDLLALASDQYQASLQYYAQLEQLAQGIRDQYSSVFLGFEEQKAKELGTGNLAVFYGEQFDALFRQLQGAASPEQLDRLTQDILTYGQKLWGMNLGDNDQANYAYRRMVEEQLREAERISQEKIKAWEEEETARRLALQDEMDRMREGLSGTTVNLSDFSNSVTGGGKAVDDFVEGLSASRAELTSFVDAIGDATVMLASLTEAGGGPAPTQGRNG